MFSVVTLLGMLAGAKFVQSDAPIRKADTALTHVKYSGRQVEEIIRFLETKYVGEVNSDELVAKAIKVIMEGLDPHTHYFPPDKMEELEERTQGHYVGIGIEVTFIGDSLVVLFPKKNSPAAKAGIHPGDFIVGVDDQAIPGDSLSKDLILKSIKGNRGTRVRLKLRPMLADTLREIVVTREEIKVPSVITGYMIDTSVAYIKINRFTNTTYREFMDHWERMATKEMAKHLVLDLRDNPGGYLKESINILSQIIGEEGKLLVYTEGKSHQRTEYKSTGKVFFTVDRVIVLINQHSASASEIIAGCLQDHDRGLIIGTRSYGKGLVQEQYELSNGGVLRMTVSKYFTPSGRLIQKPYNGFDGMDTLAIYKTISGRPVHAGGGIIPDIIVEEKINWHLPLQKRWMDLISEYAIRYNLTHHQGKLAALDEVAAIRSQLPSGEKMVDALVTLAHHRGGDQVAEMLQYLNDKKQDILHITEATLIAYRTGEEGWYRGYNIFDPVVQKAMDMIRLDVRMALEQI